MPLFSHCFPIFEIIGKLRPTDYWQNGKETGHYLQDCKVRKLHLFLDLGPKITEEDINNMTEEQKTAMLLKLLMKK